jgi:multiple sugar transport system substrate-binding protein
LFVFSDDPAKQRASWELIKYMTSDHAYTEISSKIGYLPLRTSLTEDPAALKGWADSNPLLAPNLGQLDRLEPWKSYPGNSYTQVDEILAQAVEQSVFYGKDPAATMQAAQDRAQELIN